jgi:hypothetical protein
VDTLIISDAMSGYYSLLQYYWNKIIILGILSYIILMPSVEGVEINPNGGYFNISGIINGSLLQCLLINWVGFH